MAAIGLRAWTLDARDYEGEASFRQAVVEELAASEYLGFRLGIAVVSAPIRAQDVDGGEWRTVGWTFRTATVPGITRADAAPEVDLEDPLDEPADEVAPEPEPADVSY